jgi:hypothetical protein
MRKAGRENKKFCFGHVSFEIPLKHSKWRCQICTWIYEFWEEVQARAVIWGVIRRHLKPWDLMRSPLREEYE